VAACVALTFAKVVNVAPTAIIKNLLIVVIQLFPQMLCKLREIEYSREAIASLQTKAISHLALSAVAPPWNEFHG